MTSVQAPVDLVVEQHHDRRKLIAVALVLLLIVSTPLWLWWRASSSTAAFADSEVLETNHLGAATLDLEIGQDTVLFAAENLAPGDTVSGQLELVNAGTLPLAFTVSGSSDGDLLAQWLRFDVWRTDTICRPDEPATLLASDMTLTTRPVVLMGDLAEEIAKDGSKLQVGDSTILCLGARLLLEAPNEVQGRRTEVNLVVNAVHDIEAEE